MAATYAHPRPALTADIVLFHGESVLLIRRKHPPFEGRWALPGGFLDEGETLEACAARELREETGVEGAVLSLSGVFSTPGRDPRGWTVSAAYTGDLPAGASPVAGDDAAAVEFWPLAALPPLAFDHDRIIASARNSRIQG